MLLAGCGSASHDKFVAKPCGSTERGVALKLVLRNVAPIPRVGVNRDAYAEVLSSYHGNAMTFPAAHPSTAVCEISQHRNHDGTAAVLYKAIRAGTVTFYSTFTHVTMAMMPAMLGRLIVAP